MFGGSTQKTKYELPHQDILRQIMSGGLPQVAKGYMENVAIPTTMNQATAMGLGRSGGAEEAVANAAWAPGVDIMKILLGLPPYATETTKKQRPGIFDWLGGALGLAGTGLDLYKAWPSNSGYTGGYGP